VAIFPGYELGDDETSTVTGEDGRSYKTLIGNSNAAQFIFDQNYLLPSAPQQPVASIRAMNKGVYLNWDTASETAADPYYDVASEITSPAYDPAYIQYDFAGYRVYRSLSAAGPWVSVADFDLATLQHFYQDDSVYNGVKYFYKVVAYDAQENAPLTLESLGTTLDATPRTDAVGFGDPTVYTLLPPGYEDGSVVSGNNLTTLTPIVVDPRQVTGHTYIIRVEAGTSAEKLMYSIIDDTTDEVKVLNFTAWNQSGLYAGDGRAYKWYETEPVDGIKYRIQGPSAGGIAVYTIVVDGWENATDTVGDFDITVQSYSMGSAWANRTGRANDLQFTFLETSNPNIFDVQVKDLDESIRLGENVILPFNGIGPGGDPRFTSPYVISNWTYFGNNFGRYIESGIDNLIYADGEYIILQEAYLSNAQFKAVGLDPLGAVPDELELLIDTDASRYADPGMFALLFDNRNVYEVTITQESQGTGSDLSIEASALYLPVELGQVTSDLVMRVDAYGNPNFYLKSWTTGTLTPTPYTEASDLYTVDNYDDLPTYLVRLNGAPVYGDSFLIEYDAAGVNWNATVLESLDGGSTWDLYKLGSRWLPVALDGDGYFFLSGVNVNYVEGDAPGDASYPSGMMGMYINGNIAPIGQGAVIQYIISKNMIEDGTSFITRRHGNVPKGGEYWTVDTNAMTSITANLDDVKVVPNPILPINAWDSDVNVRKAEFTNLPALCDIYIYTVAGDLVRHLVHDNGTGTEVWDTRNAQNQDIASGVYVYVVKCTDGKKEGTFAVIR